MKIKFYNSFIQYVRVMLLVLCASAITFLTEAQTLNVDALTDTDFAINEEVEITFDATGFEAGTEFAVLLTQNDESLVIGKGTTSPITASIPVALPLDEGCPGVGACGYQIEVIPFVPDVAGGDFFKNESYSLSDEDYWTEIVGESDLDFSIPEFVFGMLGDRYAETASFDFSESDSVYISFLFDEDGFIDNDTTVNQSLIPRLEVSSDGGATYNVMSVDLADYYEEGFLYDNANYSLKVPTSGISANTRFRWIQPLNLGSNVSQWLVGNVEIENYQGNEVETYTATGDVFGVTLGNPDLGNYEWKLVDNDDPIYSGESFLYSWDSVGVADAFPAGTEFTFTINETDLSTGENIVLDVTTALGQFTAEIPDYLSRGSYAVYLTASVVIDGEEYRIYDAEAVGTFDVFTRVVRTVHVVANPNAVIYAGEDATFSIDIENELEGLDVSTFYANLIVNYGGDDWLLAAQQGIADISIALPPFIRNNDYDFRIELSENAPLGQVGEIIEDNDLSDLEDDDDNFIAGFQDSEVSFENGSGRGVITTRDFEVGELEGAQRFEFTLFLGGLAEDLTLDQYLIFEYSTDGGASYTALRTFPEMDAVELINEETFRFDVSDDMKQNATRFRWRQEEIKGEMDLYNISFTFNEPLPYDYLSANVDIASQALLISSISAEEFCSDADIEINYEIRGRFGAESMVSVGWENDGDDDIIEGAKFNLTEGTGTITVTMPTDVLFDFGNNTSFRFYLDVEDETFIDIGEYYTFEGPYSEQQVELVALIDVNVEFDLESDVLACDPTEVLVYLDEPQDYFTYEIRNAESGAALGSLTYDPEEGNDQINLGVITENMTLEMAITSKSSSGLECNTLVASTTIDLQVLSNLALYRGSSNNSSLKILVEAGDSITICEGSTGQVNLSVNRLTASGIGSNQTSGVEWFRDSFLNPVSFSGSVLGDNESLVAGDYFARITTGSCEYITESFMVNVLEAPARPVITVDSGELTFCEGEGEVVLSAPAGFDYYRWSASGVESVNGSTARSITVEYAGSYAVQVSNVPFSVGCSSPSSVPVVVETKDKVELTVQTTPGSYNPQYQIAEGETVSGCEDVSLYLLGNGSTSFNGVVTLYKDGQYYASTTNNAFYVQDSGSYYAEWESDELGSVCTSTSPTFTVDVSESIEDAPVITTPDVLSFCEGNTATLTATAGFEYYRWYRNNSLININSATLIADLDGRYQVEVSNIPFTVGCYSDRSAGVDVNVYSDPNMFLTSSTTGTLQSGEEVDACAADQFFLYASNIDDNPVTWYFDGTAIPASAYSSGTSSSALEVTDSGEYFAEIVVGGTDASTQCIYTTATVVVNYFEELEVVSIAASDTTEFCEGEVNVTLTADVVADANYTWYRANIGSSSFSAITDGDGTSNSLVVTGEGKYYVVVANGGACESDPSNVIIINSQTLANPNITVSTFNADCQTGDVTVQLSGTNAKTSYQLINQETGEVIGTPVTGSTSDPVYTVLSGLTESVSLMVEASYADGTGCPQTSTGSRGTATPDNVVLEIDGNSLIANVYGDDLEFTWYRNGVEMKNATSNSIKVTDAATYSVEVLFRGGCSLVSNAVDLGTPPVEEEEGESGGRIAVSAYPNPSPMNEITVGLEGLNFGTYQVYIMTLSGQVRISTELEKNSTDFAEQISISNLQPGIYNMKIVKGKQIENIRIIKN